MAGEKVTRVGFIGLGIMGTAMATRLARAGYPLVVYNRTVERTRPLAELGASVAESPRMIAEQIDVVITMVSNGAALRAVTLGESGVLAAMHEGQMLINMSTVSPAMTRDLAAACSERRVEFIDAPVSGSKPQAESGELVILGGGDSNALDRAEPILLTMGKKVVRAGAAGKGTALKLAVNLILAHLAAALAEGFTFCDAVELDPTLLLNVLSSAPALNAGYFQGKGKKILDRDFAPQFPLKHMLKDVRLVLDETDLPVASAIEREMSKDARTAGDLDLSVLMQVRLERS